MPPPHEVPRRATVCWDLQSPMSEGLFRSLLSLYLGFNDL